MIVKAKIWTVVPLKSGHYAVMMQRHDLIDDPSNPFFGDRKVSSYCADKPMMRQLMSLWQAGRVRDLIGKDVELDLQVSGRFDRIIGVRKLDPIWNFFLQKQALPKWLTEYSAVEKPVGLAYFQKEIKK